MKPSKPRTELEDKPAYPTANITALPMQQATVRLHVSLPSHSFFQLSPSTLLLPTCTNAQAGLDACSLPSGEYTLYPCPYLQPLALPFGCFVLYPIGSKPVKARSKAEVPDIEPYGYAFTNTQGSVVTTSACTYSPNKILEDTPGISASDFVKRPTPLAFRTSSLVIFHASGGSTILLSPVISQKLSTKITSL